MPCDHRVGRRSRKGEVPRLLLEIVNERGCLHVYRAAAAGDMLEVHGRTEQRVREAHDAVAAHCDRPDPDASSASNSARSSTERLPEQRRRRPLDRRHELEQRPRVLRERADPFADQLLERRRNRQLRLEVCRLALGRACELECEHWVAVRGGMDGCDLRPRKPHVEPLAQKLLEVADAERADRKLRIGTGLQRVCEAERVGHLCRTSHRLEDTDRLVPERRTANDSTRADARIEPLGVVDCEKQWRIGGQRAERGDDPT